jgi:NADH-quinone oxidoreductase subunit N
MLSLAGLPPLAGFFGKFYLFSVALRAGANHGLLWLVALALFGSLVSLYYYLIVLKVIFTDQSDDAATSIAVRLGSDIELLQRIALSVLAIVVLLLGIMPGILLTQIAVSL